MKSFKTAAVWVLGYLCLNLYVNGLPRLFQFEVLHWFAYWGGFFLLAFLISRYLVRLKGLSALGMALKPGWWGQLGLGFLLGFAIWACKYTLFWALGKFTIAGLADASFIMPLIGQALLAMFFAALLNDISIRGYWYAYYRQTNALAGFLLISTLLYCLDDFWNEGFDLMNLAFSAILGISLAFAVYQTGAIWLCTGIHWGGNLVYRLLYGFNGQGILKLELVREEVWYDWLSLGVTALLIPILYYALRNGQNARPQAATW